MKGVIAVVVVFPLVHYAMFADHDWRLPVMAIAGAVACQSSNLMAKYLERKAKR